MSAARFRGRRSILYAAVCLSAAAARAAEPLPAPVLDLDESVHEPAGRLRDVPNAREQPVFFALKEKVRLAAPDPARAEALDQALAALVQSPAALDAARELLAFPDPVAVSFAPTGCRFTEMERHRVVVGTLGTGDAGDAGVRVALCDKLLDADPDYRRSALPAALVHEMLGHGLMALKARRVGAGDAYRTLRENEENAKLLGWTFLAELDLPLWDDDVWKLVDDAAAYRDALVTWGEKDSAMLSVSEMRDPAGALERRRALLSAVRRKSDWGACEMALWPPAVDHFVSVHGMPADAFRDRRREVDDFLAEAAAVESSADAVEASLRRAADFYRSPRRAAYVRRLQEQSRSPFIAAALSRTAARRERLRVLLKSRSRTERYFPTEFGQYGWRQLKGLVRRDRKEHPEHWTDLDRRRAACAARR
jgi:hypothetical protein